MKKITVFLLVMFVITGVLTAQEEDGYLNGLYTGGEVGIGDFDDVKNSLNFRPFAGYETEIKFDDYSSIEVSAELGVPVALYETEEFNLLTNSTKKSKKMGVGIDLNLYGAYSINTGNGTITASLESWNIFPLENEAPILIFPALPVLDGLAAITGINFSDSDPMGFMGFGVNYSQNIEIGKINTGLQVPFLLYAKGVDPFELIYLNIIAGLDTDNFGGEITIYNTLRFKSIDDINIPMVDISYDKLFTYIDLYGYFRIDNFCLGLTLGIPLYEISFSYSLLFINIKNGIKGMDIEGIALTPEAEFSINENLSIYTEIPISGLGSKDITVLGEKIADKTGVSVGLTLGVKYSF